MTIEELKQNKELFEQCEKEIEAKVQAGEEPVSAAIAVFKAHGAEVDEDALRAEAVEKMKLSQEEMDHVSGGVELCFADHACYYILCHDSDKGKAGEACFNDYECNLSVKNSACPLSGVKKNQ